MIDLTKYSIQELAALVVLDWKRVDPHAGEYLMALLHVRNIGDKYFLDDVDDIVSRFLINAGGWHGEMARTVKFELKRRLKEYQKAKKIER
ncbi:hypothetical protein RsoM2USA_333 [Ralstonia phage RsoM2USA]|nr:hypothetical protein RsoM2USA_333 [Ralstonia phage RsoM2USA]